MIIKQLSKIYEGIFRLIFFFVAKGTQGISTDVNPGLLKMHLS